MSTHNLCFRAKIRKNVYPCTPQCHYIKVGCKGVFITRTCLHDGMPILFRLLQALVSSDSVWIIGSISFLLLPDK